MLSLDSGEIRPFATGPFDEASPSFSPDGAWVAYHSDESGRWEVYLRRTDGRGGKIPVSVDGSIGPTWMRGANEIVFWNGNRVESVTVPQDPSSGLGGRRRGSKVPPIWVEGPLRDGTRVPAESF